MQCSVGGKQTCISIGGKLPLSKTDIEKILKRNAKTYSKISHNGTLKIDMAFQNIVVSSGTLTTLVSMASTNVDGFVSPPMTVISG